MQKKIILNKEHLSIMVVYSVLEVLVVSVADQFRVSGPLEAEVETGDLTRLAGDQLLAVQDLGQERREREA